MEYVPRERLFAEAGLFSLHVPLLPDTHHLVDTGALAPMKDDAVRVNSGRGGLVDTDALLETLRAGRLSGVGLDVCEEEAGVFFLGKSLEVMTDERLARLMTFSNVLVTSYQAYFTRDAVGPIAQTTVASIEDYFAGRTGENTLPPKSSPLARTAAATSTRFAIKAGSSVRFAMPLLRKGVDGGVAGSLRSTMRPRRCHLWMR
jgi:D-lactate dehydrogenase